jgi:hypothetical protein
MNKDLLRNSKDLEEIESFLDAHTLPEDKKLRTFSKQLKKIDLSISQSLSSNPENLDSLEKQKALVQKLAGRCHLLEIRKDIIELAELAEELANTSPDRDPREIALEANLLRNRIDAFLEVHRPSKNNAKFLRFAKACIEKAERQEPVLVSKNVSTQNVVSLKNYQKEETTVASFELAENLYCTATFLYRDQTNEFIESLSNNFSDTTLMELRFHVQECGGDLQKLSTHEDRMHIIQGVLGYAHKVTDYYTDSTPYPSLVEIHHIFDDLDLVNQAEEDFEKEQ